MDFVFGRALYPGGYCHTLTSRHRLPFQRANSRAPGASSHPVTPPRCLLSVIASRRSRFHLGGQVGKPRLHS